MTEFTELDTKKDIEDMDEDEARKTLAEFMDEHEKNTEAYDELRTEFDEKVSDKEERIEDLEDRVSEFKARRAEEAAQYVNMPADILADRFEFSELDQIIEEAEEAGAEGDATDGDPDESEDGQNLTSFSEKPQKGRQEKGDGIPKEYRERAESRMKQVGFPTSD